LPRITVGDQNGFDALRDPFISVWTIDPTLKHVELRASIPREMIGGQDLIG
jgi:hypothetical protein